MNFARTHELLLSLRCGGHSAPGYGTNDGGMVIDMPLMKGIRVDPSAPIVDIEVRFIADGKYAQDVRPYS